MLVLMTKSHPSQLRYRHPNLGRLIVPRDCARVDETAAAGIPWAADNGAFRDFQPAAFRRMVERAAGVPGCLFVAVPDVVADAAATGRRFRQWAPLVERADLPLALVAQDGLTPARVPWDSIAALFIGGSTVWKMGPEAHRLILAAKGRGVWVHLGRVNRGNRRITWAKAVGCDSIDGTAVAKWTDAHLPGQLLRAAGPVQGTLLAGLDDPPAC
jgi:hypothetical protein